MTSTIPPRSCLPPAPKTLIAVDGQPRCGKFAGTVDQIDWTGLAAPYARGKVWRYFHHKRWQYVALATEQVFCGVAIVDLGWTNTAFAYAFDRRSGKLAGAYSQNGLPGLTARIGNSAGTGAPTPFRFLANRIDFSHLPCGRGYRLALRCGEFEIDAELDAGNAAPLLLAGGPIEGGSVHATQKSSGMPMRGEVRAGRKRFDLNGGVASFDYSNGFLARRTKWRWASAHGLDLGFNLQAGDFGSSENALWLDGRLIGLADAHFDFNPDDPLAPWHIHTGDGLLDLRFEPEGLRREDKNLLIASSRYVQPIGTFSGWVKPAADAAPRSVHRLVGVTEDHLSLW